MSGETQKKYFIGTHQPGKWSSVYTYCPQKPEFIKRRGEIFASITLLGPEDFNVATAGNLLLDHLHESYFENESDSVMMSLEKAILSTQRYLQKLLEKDTAADEGINLDLTVMVLHEETAYFVNMGEGHIHIFRDGNLVDIVGALKDPTGEGLIKTGSTLVKRADVILISSPVVIDEMTLDELVDLLVEFSDVKLKRRKFDREAEVSMLMVGYQIDRREARAEHGMVVDQEESQGDSGDDKEKKVKSFSEAKEAAGVGEQAEPGVQEKDQPQSEEKQEDEYDDGRAGGGDDSDDQKNLGEKISAEFSGFIGNIKQGVVKVKDKVAKGRAGAVRGRSGDLESEDDFDKPTYMVIFKRIQVVIVNVAMAIKGTVWDNWLGMGKGGIYLKSAGRSRNWRFIIIVIVIVVGLLYFSIKSINERNQQIALENEAKLNLDSAIEIIDEVDKVAPIIAQATSNEERKQAMLERLDEAETELDQADDVENFVDDVSTQQDRISEIRDLLNKTIALTDPEVIVDLAGVIPGANASDITLADNKVYISDREYGKIYSTAYAGGEIDELVQGLSKPRSITADSEGNIVVLDENSDERLATVNKNNGTINRHSGTSEFRLGKVQQIEFADIFGGRVYGIDQSIKAVVALQRSGDAYGIPEKRFELPQLSTGNDIQISDLKVYLIADIKQGLYRALNNVNDTPILVGLAPGENLHAATAMFVDDVHIFIADPENRRILVFKKDLEELNLRAQYKYKGDGSTFSDIREIVADRKAGKLFVLDGSKVYALELSDLNEF
ncbi:MAG: hypothetical protein ACE5DX_03175 [Candidatus Dojkabacteria bacterium]